MTAEWSPEKALDKIRKLLAKAEADGVTEAEAKALNDKAAELIAQYGIDRARLAAEKPETDQITRKTIIIASAFSRDKSELVWAITDPLRVEAIRYQMQGRRDDGRHGTYFRMELVGWKSDIERVELLYTSLLLQSAHELARLYIPPARTWRPTGGPGCPASTIIVRQRLTEAEEAAAKNADAEQPASPGDSAGHVDGPGPGRPFAGRQAGREARVRRRQAGEGPHASTAPASPTGAAAGRRANLHTSSSVGRRTAGALR